MTEFYYRIHPRLKNPDRTMMEEWLTETFGARDNQNRWCITSNYDFDVHSDFDVYLKRKEDVTLFMLSWPNSVRLSLTDRSKTHEEANPQLKLFEW